MSASKTRRNQGPSPWRRARNSSGKTYAGLMAALRVDITTWTHSTEAVISPNKTYLLVRAYVTGIGGICLQGFDFLFSKEPVAFARFEALTHHFCVHFPHHLPRPNLKP